MLSDDDVIAECLQILAMFTKEYASKWRTQVYKAALVKIQPRLSMV